VTHCFDDWRKPIISGLLSLPIKYAVYLSLPGRCIVHELNSGCVASHLRSSLFVFHRQRSFRISIALSVPPLLLEVSWGAQLFCKGPDNIRDGDAVCSREDIILLIDCLPVLERVLSAALFLFLFFVFSYPRLDHPL
jgi:hypothetical protein